LKCHIPKGNDTESVHTKQGKIMTQKTRHYCKCGERAIVENNLTGEWFCPECAVEEMFEYVKNGHVVSVSHGSGGPTDVLIAPRDDGTEDVFAPLAEVEPISFCRN